MAFTASIVSCSSKEMGSDMWNLYSGTHPDLHDNYMDPPERIMVHPHQQKAYPHCASDKDKKCFDMYYGAQSIIQNPYTTSAVMEVERCCTFTIEEVICNDINGNTKPAQVQKKGSSTKNTSKRSPSKHSPKKEPISSRLLAVPHYPTKNFPNCNDLRRNKSDSDISSLDGGDAAPTRPRILSDGSAHATDKPCVCKCSCGSGRDNIDCSNGAASRDEQCHKKHGKSRHKSRSLKNFLHGILS